MCDYSLHAIASRPAKVGERLVSANFPGTTTRGFADINNPDVAVCLMPGTELAFDEPVEFCTGFLSRRRQGSSLARFRELNVDRSHEHHDAIEMADGQVVLVTQLMPGQYATVLQLPVQAEPQKTIEATPANQITAPRREEDAALPFGSF